MNDEKDKRPRGPKAPGKRGDASRPAPRKGFAKRGDAGLKPYGKREDADRKPFRKREDGDRRPFRKREEGEGKSFAKRRDDAGETRSERPKREFRRDDRPDGERKPFRKRDEGDRKPFARREDGDRKPFRKRDDDRAPRADRETFRPGRREREAAAAGEAAETGERIAKRLARAGVASRRDAEELIAAGRVTVNGKVLESPAVNVTARDRIALDGDEIPPIERTRLFLFHKPIGVVTTNRDPEGRRTVFDILPPGLPRLMTVGRLDINTEGLLLLTNDGGLSRVLELPATGWLRRYRVRVHGKVEPEALEGLKEGIAVDGVFYGGVGATLDREQGSNAWLTVGLREGKNREVKNILGALGLDVTRLIRVSYGPFQLGELAEGEVRELRGRLLRDQLGERLIEEAGANFDAPVLNEFSNKPVSAPAAKRDGDAPRPNRKREREQKREDALGRLQTRPERGGKPGFKQGRGGKPGLKEGRGRSDRDARDERPADKPRSRTSNVWMAPGARPMGEKQAAAHAARTEGRRYAGKPKPAGKKSSTPTSPSPRPRGEGKGEGQRGGRGPGAPRKPRKPE